MSLTYDEKLNIVQINDDIEAEMLVPLYEFINKYEDKVKSLVDKPEIKIFINSRGGCAHTCFSITEAILKLSEKYKVTTIGLGEVSSAAVPIWLAGNLRLTQRYTMYLIHEVSWVIRGTLSHIAENVEQLDITNKIYQSIIMDRTNIPESHLKHYGNRKKDFILYGNDMIRYLRFTEREVEYYGDQLDVEPFHIDEFSDNLEDFELPEK